MDQQFLTCGETGPSSEDIGRAWERIRLLAVEKRRELRELGLADKADEASRYSERRSDKLDQLVEIPAHPGAILAVRVRNEPWEGLPQVFDCWLGFADAKHGTVRDISERQPFNSLTEAESFFSEALSNRYAQELASKIRGGTSVALFGSAASPSATSLLLEVPNPSARDLHRVFTELREAVAALNEIIEKRQNDDAFKYIASGLLGPQGRVFMRMLPRDIHQAFRWLNETEARTTWPKVRPGRPLSAGKKQLLAVTLKELWERCGLGTPSLSPTGRFIRACQIVLPWHHHNDPDVAQFMKAALGKQRRKGVVIG
jgi:hypothetical protein